MYAVPTQFDKEFLDTCVSSNGLCVPVTDSCPDNQQNSWQEMLDRAGPS